MSDLLRSSYRVALLLLAVVMAGCGGKSEPEVLKSGEEKTAGDQRIIPIRRDVKSLDGNWVLLVTVQGRDSYIWIVGIKKGDDGKYQAEIVDSSNDKYDPKIVSSEISDKSVRLQIKNAVALIDFEGDFDGVAIRGTLANGPQEIYPARLLPTEADKLATYVSNALPPGADVFLKAIKSMENQPQPNVILQLAHEHRTSPVALDAVFGLLTLNARAKFDDATVHAIIERYLELSKVWGTRMNAQAEMLIAQQLITAGRMPGEALQHLDAAEKLMGERATAIKPQLQMFRDQAQIHQSLAKSHSKSAEDRAAAHTELQEGLKKQPYNADILLALAEYCLAEKQTDAAIEYYSTLSALPLLEQFILARRAGQPAGDPLPSDILKKLWTERHGNTDELQAHLSKIYRDVIGKLRKQLREQVPTVPPADSGNHTVLVEFFTGGQMPPAVATEIAVDAVRETYPTSQVVALRYHQHIPGPDGLVNQDGEDRLAFYGQSRVPLLTLDGAMMDPDQVPYGGFMQSSGTAYTILRAVIDARLKQTTPIQLALSGKIEGDELKIEANVTGASEEMLSTLKLRLALAEENVEATLVNGIRDHAMVVREMPGGARGIAPKKGELKFSYSMPVGDLQQHLDDYLSRYESGKKIEIPKEMKPPIRNPLYLVGWVQDDRTDSSRPEVGRAILQTAIVPVVGSGAAETPATTPSESPAETTAPDKPPAPALPQE